ncbi:unnamed protein product [Toxocara canis]|uniref:Fibronectin type-III domain-containing protein n=1 Tax=Toxocara canis TaxID=6265 RepID=A0A183U3W7_TOXCA|nr:unnamed protein product [Toxocara canis]
MQAARHLSTVQIRTNNPFVSVDAVQFVSPPSNPRCSLCSPFEYLVYRSPQFDDSKPIRTRQHYIVDRSVKEGIRYEYSVAVLSNGTEGIRSPPTSFVPGQNVCGDGNRAGSEECDDGNLEDGDGSLSLCYIYDGDGECEAFERALSTKDCGIFVPPGYRHHFPSNIYAQSTTIDFNCSMSHLLTIPQTTGCHVLPLAWGPCSPLATERISVNAEFTGDVFPSSVLINIAAITASDFGSASSTLGVELIHSDGSITALEEQLISSCSQNPIEFAIVYTLLKKPLVTQYVRVTISNPLLIAITSIILRSSKTFDLFAIQKCTGEISIDYLVKFKFCNELL